jgi:hypothetical protein
LVADGLIFGEQDAPTPNRQLLQLPQNITGVAPGDPAGLEQGKLLTHLIQGHLHQEQAIFPGGSLNRPLITALPEAEQKLKGEGATPIARIGSLGGRGGLGSAGERQSALASNLQKGQSHEVGSISHGEIRNGEPFAKIKNPDTPFAKNK